MGILLVILQHCLGGGHLGCMPGLQKAIASFHMPLFFFVSGFLYKKKPYKEYLFSKMSSLVIPYGIVLIVNWFLLNICIVLHKIILIENYFQIIKLEGYWFIICLIYISIIYFYIDYYVIGKNYTQLVLLGISFVCGLTCGHWIQGSPNMIATSFVVLFFFMAGVFSRKIFQRVDIKNHRIGCLVLGGVILIINFFISCQNTLVTVARNEYGNVIFFYLCSLLGIAGIFLFGYGISMNYVLEFYGKNTLVILTTQFPIYRLIMILLKRVNVNEFINIWICFILTSVVEVIVVISINKFFPLFAGKIPNRFLSVNTSNIYR